MQRKFRLSGTKQFNHIHQDGTSAANRFLVIRFVSNGLSRSRFGFMVSKRIGNAVVRNKVKRRLRETVRLTPLKAGWDAVFIARRDCAKADFQQLNLAAVSLLRRSRLIDTNSEAADGERQGSVRQG